MLTRRQLLSNLGLTVAGAGLPLQVFAKGPAPASGKVIVVGGGLSGLTAAYALASRGVKVEVIEAEARLGGRARSRRWNSSEGDASETALPQAHFLLPEKAATLRDVLAQMGVASALSPHFERPAFLLDGRRIAPQKLGGRLKWMSALWQRARGLGDRMIPLALRQGLRWNSALSVDQAIDSIGGQSVEDWHARGAPLTPWKAFRAIFSPLVFNAGVAEVDAAAFALAEQFYRGEEAGVQCLVGDAQTHLWQPIREALEALGVSFRMGVEVTELSFSGGRVSGLTLGGFGEGVWIEDVPQGWTEIPRENTAPIRIFRDTDGSLKAYAGRPGFGEDPGLYVVEASDGIHIEGEDTRSHLSADNVILACGAESAWALAGDVLGLAAPPRTRGRVRGVFHLDLPLPPEVPAWILPEAGHCVSARVLGLSEGGGSILALEATAFSEDEAVTLDQLQKELAAIWPETHGATVTARALTQWSVPVPEPGWVQAGLSEDGAMPGLVSAGEHLFHGSHAHGFEAAARSGRVAADTVLAELAQLKGSDLELIVPDRDISPE